MGSDVLKVLLAEDDLMIADLVEDALIANGYAVCGIARTVIEAIELIRLHHPDLAVIDMRLADGELGTEIIALLPDGPPMGILYASGNISQVIELAERDACIEKPFHAIDLVRALRLVQEIIVDGVASPPFPHGFHLLHTKNTLQSEPVDV
jgi:DNA-binding response OmpR family regulator